MTRRIDASFGVQTAYTLRSVWGDLVKRKFGTLLTILVIAVSLTIPTVSYLLWKNLHLATTQFYPESELTIYLHKNLSEEDANLVVEKIRQQEGVESLNYVSRQESLKEFKSWSGFGEELEILDDNPLPAVVMVKPSKDFNASEKRAELRTNLNKIKGVQEVRLDNDWMEKLTALSWLFAHVAIFCTVLMTIAVFLVINYDEYNILLDPNVISYTLFKQVRTQEVILRPYLYTGMIYAVLGGLVAALFSSLIVGYFTSAVKYVTDIFAVTFELNGLGVGELIFLLVSCLIMGYVGAWIAATRHIAMLDNKL